MAQSFVKYPREVDQAPAAASAAAGATAI